MKYFTLEELCFSVTANTQRISNVPASPAIVDNLRTLVNNLLDPARELLGTPILVNSGYRCEALNRAVGGAEESQHRYGQAADITCSNLPRLFAIVTQLCDFDQAILYRKRNFLHVSYVNKQNNRHQIIIKP